MHNDRDITLDVLRVLAAFAVVVLHVSAKLVVQSPSVSDGMWWYGNVADSASRWCVPVFVMISGALLLGRCKVSPGAFYKRRFGRLLVPVLAWSIFYLAWDTVRGEELTVRYTIASLLDGGAYYHMWYLYMAVGLYALTPLLSQGVANASPGKLVALAASVFCFSIPVAMRQALIGGSRAPFVMQSVLYVGYYVLGYAIVRSGAWHGKPGWRVWGAFYVVSVTATAGTTAWLLPGLGTRSWQVAYNYLNPVVVLMSLSVFAGVRAASAHVPERCRSPVLWRKASDLAFGTYLVHPFWFDVVRLGNRKAALTSTWWGLPAFVIGVFVLSASSAFVIRRVPVLQRVV